MQKTIKEHIEQMNLHPQNFLDEIFSTIEKENKDLFAFVRLHKDYAIKNVNDFIQKKLCGAPIGIKDNILTKDYISSSGSKILVNYVSPYSATCIENLENSGGLMIGKTNMDEFAMGSSTETSAFGKTLNPYGTNRIPGGSSGGSACAVASGMVLGALGTDTGGSVRQPASMCGVVGVKPTYGRVSRYGVQSLASSLDQIGTFTNTVEDAVILLDAISGFDPKDPTSKKFGNSQNRYTALNNPICKKVAVFNDFFDEGIDPQISVLIKEKIDGLKNIGIEVDYIDFPLLHYGLPIYYILMPSEVSTNLARFDGIRFGLQEKMDSTQSLEEYISMIRAKGFGAEVKRRILLGNYVLSHGYYDAYYIKAQQVKQKMINEFEKLFGIYDAVIGPTTPTVAWKLGTVQDPIQMYMSDIYTIPANLTGMPAISVPVGMIENLGEQMPVGLHIMTDSGREDKMFSLAQQIFTMK